MRLLGIKPKFSNPLAGHKFKELDSLGGAYRYSRVVDFLVVCYSRGVDLQEYAPPRDSTCREYAPPGNQTPQEYPPVFSSRGSMNPLGNLYEGP